MSAQRQITQDDVRAYLTDMGGGDSVALGRAAEVICGLLNAPAVYRQHYRREISKAASLQSAIRNPQSAILQ